MGLAMVTETANAPDMQYSVTSPADLSAADRRAWAQLRAQNPALYSPYFHYDYALTIAGLRDDVRVIIGSVDGRAGAFPRCLRPQASARRIPFSARLLIYQTALRRGAPGKTVLTDGI